ncbi:MAG TPA: hypothetical protein VFT45_07120 [Longimicrobium sp.]|nr:hypothetical protein [Longimicrobium sp.]
MATVKAGWMLAWLYKRLHPQLAFYKLWAFWSAILGGVVALLIALGAVRM